MSLIIKDDNPYYTAYNIMSLALNYKAEEGISKALYLIKIWFNASDVIIYKKNTEGDYIHKFNQTMMANNSLLVTNAINSAKELIENRVYYQLVLHIENLRNILFIPIDLQTTKYVIAITTEEPYESIDEKCLELLIQSMQTILKNYEKDRQFSKKSEKDFLTGLNNRNTYESVVSTASLSEGMIYVIFDLFRLKNINDNYSHAHGDEYIKRTADILKKHFPKYVYTVDATGKRSKVETGSCLYRVGGDEFVLISYSENLDNVRIKLAVIQEEVRNIELNINEPLGINYGVVAREGNETFQDLYLKADKYLSASKSETYKVLGLDRRK